MEALRTAQESLTEYKRQQKITTTNIEHRTTQRRSNNSENWKPPPRSGLKLNVDAHRLAGDGHWGIGLVLRKEDGELVGARTKVIHGFDDVVEAEAMGLEAAIEMGDRILEKEVFIEMDNKMVVQAVSSGRYPRNY
jgi:hypothetical protein